MTHHLTIVMYFMLVFVLSGCYGPRQQTGVNAQADLVVYFVADATDEQVLAFWDETISVPSPTGEGWEHKPGIGSVEATEPFGAHDAVAIYFEWGASQAEKDTIKELLLSSPLVYRVLEDAVPSQVESLDP